ncbi:hypothetical protein ACFXTO_034820 [Malus domestica]
MKSPKLLNPQTLKTLQAPTHFPQKPPPSAAPLSSLAHPTSPLPITHHILLTSSQSSQWYFIKHISPNIPPSLISDALFDLRKSPELFLKFISQIEFHRLDVDIRCLAIAIVAQPSPKRSFDLEASERLSEKSSLGFDLLVQACCEMKKADEALECFYLMKDKGRLKKATEFLGFMETLGIQANVVTYNTIIHGYCSIGRVGRAQMLFSALKDKGVELDSYTYADHVGLEGHYHWLLQLIVFASVMAAVTATCFRTNLPAALVLSISVVFQGCWFMNMGFMLRVSRFAPKGCAVHFVEGNGDSMLGAVTCGTSKCIPREVSIEYEQLQSRGADVPIAINDFKEVRP